MMASNSLQLNHRKNKIKLQPISGGDKETTPHMLEKKKS